MDTTGILRLFDDQMRRRAAPDCLVVGEGWSGVTWPPDDNPPVDEVNPKQTRWVSYGYPAGANVKRLNTVVVPASP